MKTLNNTQMNTMTNSVAGAMVNEDNGLTPRECLAVGMVFTNSLEELSFNGTEEFLFHFENKLADVKVDGQVVVIDFDATIASLVSLGFLAFLLETDVIVFGDVTCRILDLDTAGYAPALASDGVNRRRNWSKTGETSELLKEAVRALEATEFMASTEMLTLARNVWMEAGEDAKVILDRNLYVLKGTAEMAKGEAHVSEFFADARGRLYQAACFGPNGQSSDIARAMMDLAGVSTNYDVVATKELLMAEIADMGSWADDAAMEADMADAVANSTQFVLTHLAKKLHIAKVWNFVKFAKIVAELDAGNTPYIGVAVGLDAKCSGPQLGALMVADQQMMAATGFSMEMVNDAYHNAIVECEKVGIMNLTRNLIKKPFMAVFYGAGKDAMLDADTITQDTWNALYAGLAIDAQGDMCELFYKAVNASFGRALNVVRRSVKNAGFDYDNNVTKLATGVQYRMPCGFKVAMDYKFKLNIEGQVCQYNELPTMTKVESGFDTQTFKNATFRTKDVDTASFARTGFVNMIQATDALLARLIVVHLDRMGAQHIIAVHDCFRVNIHDMAILNEAIKQAYLDLFGTTKDEASTDLPLGTDILKSYFEGNLAATKEEYKAEAPMHSQFYTKGARMLRSVNRVMIKDLINNLGVTYYFAK